MTTTPQMHEQLSTPLVGAFGVIATFIAEQDEAITGAPHWVSSAVGVVTLLYLLSRLGWFWWDKLHRRDDHKESE